MDDENLIFLVKCLCYRKHHWRHERISQWENFHTAATLITTIFILFLKSDIKHCAEGLY